MKERVGAFPSPTVLVDGIDVMRPNQAPPGEYCRLDVPTRAAIMAALLQASTHDGEVRERKDRS